MTIDKTIGFIGCGNMGKAMIEGMIKSKMLDGEQLFVSNAHPEKLKEFSVRHDFYISDNLTVAKQSDILFLAVKPYMYASVIDEIKEWVKQDVIIVNIAAGIEIDDIYEMFGRKVKTVRAMPNTPALVQAAMSAISFGDNISENEQSMIVELFSGFGQAHVIAEKQMDAVIAISGSSPAYIFIVIEAMADGAVALGMARDDAYVFAAQAVFGAAKMVLETGMHPGVLKDMVCSPGGTTMEAVKVLERHGLRYAFMDAMQACAEKNAAMKSKK